LTSADWKTGVVAYELIGLLAEKLWTINASAPGSIVAVSKIRIGILALSMRRARRASLLYFIPKMLGVARPLTTAAGHPIRILR